MSTLIVPDAIVECNLHDVGEGIAIKLYAGEWQELFYADLIIAKYYADNVLIKGGAKSSAAALPALPPGDHPVYIAFRSPSGGFDCDFTLTSNQPAQNFRLYSGQVYKTTDQPSGFKLLSDPIFKLTVS